jgi:hypothetical protein
MVRRTHRARLAFGRSPVAAAISFPSPRSHPGNKCLKAGGLFHVSQVLRSAGRFHSVISNPASSRQIAILDGFFRWNGEWQKAPAQTAAPAWHLSSN